MSRLDRMIARLTTQRANIAEARARIGDLPGPVLEIGLGKGRTYTHLLSVFPDRDIWVFDLNVHAPAAACPPEDRLILGDLRATLPRARDRIGALAALAHVDIGTEDPALDADLARSTSADLPGLMAVGGIVIGDREMTAPSLEPIVPPPVDLPDGIDPWPSFLYRVVGI